MSDYYPEFYLRKRQREQAYRRVTAVIVGVLIFLAIGGGVGYFGFNWWKTQHTKPGATPELAAQQQQLQTQQQLASAQVPKDVLQNTPTQPSVDLGAVKYSESFPQVGVKVGNTAPKSGDQATAVGDKAGAGDQNGATDQPPAVGRDGDQGQASDSTATPPADNSSASTPPPDTNSAVAAPPVSPEQRVTPTDSDAAKRKLEEQKREDEAKRTAQKREDARHKADQQKRDELKKQADEDAKLTAPPKSEKADAKDDKSVRAPVSKQSAGYTYTVYGGTFLKQEDADKARGDLSALGLSGSVIKVGGDYLVRVGSFEDQDSAAALSSKLKGSGLGGAFVTRKAK